MTYQYHDESIVTELPEDTVFVFGSNMAGQHGSGAHVLPVSILGL